MPPVSSPTPDNPTRLLTATLEYITSHGFHDTPTHAIARRARLGSATLFRHFPTKDALLQAAFAYARTLLSRQMPLDPPPTTLYDLVRAHWQQAAQRAADHPAAFHYWRLFRATPLDPTGDPAQGAPLDLFRPVLDQVRQVRGRTYFGDCDAWLMVAQWSAAVHFILARYDCSPGVRYDPSEGATPGQTLERAYESWWRSLGLSPQTPIGRP